jgi:DNA-binding beta-propeller fold protein YncE
MISAPAAGLMPLSPTALVASSDGKALYLACATSNCVLCFDVARQKVSDSITMPESPSGLVLSADGRRLYVTCTAPESKVCIIDLTLSHPMGEGHGKIVGTIPVGHCDGP